MSLLWLLQYRGRIWVVNMQGTWNPYTGTIQWYLVYCKYLSYCTLTTLKMHISIDQNKHKSCWIDMGLLLSLSQWKKINMAQNLPIAFSRKTGMCLERVESLRCQYIIMHFFTCFTPFEWTHSIDFRSVECFQHIYNRARFATESITGLLLFCRNMN